MQNCNLARSLQFLHLDQGCTTCSRKRICSREIVLQNARCGGRALIKMFCNVTVKK